MTEELKHTGYGLHSDPGAATVDTDVEGSQELQEIASSVEFRRCLTYC